jgi:hypothetical protein
MKNIFKKCYCAIVQDVNGNPYGSVVVRVPFYQTAIEAHARALPLVGSGYIVKFDRIK